MYKVSIVNGDDEIIINEVSTNKHAPRILGTVKLGINTIDSFTFKIFFDNPGYDKIKPYATIVKVYNTLKNKYEFIGRPITPSKQMESSGVFYKEYICESVKGFMYDSMQKYKEWHNVTPRAYLEYLVEYHNNQVEDDYKKFRVGAVTVKDSNDSLYRYTSYESTYKNINDDLVNPLAGELVVRYGDGEAPWTLDLLENFGEKSETKIKMGINMDSISEKVDFTNFGTRIIPLGAKIKTSDESGNEKETEERVTIESVNDGKMYIDLPELIEKYGVVEKIVSFDDVTLPENLIKKGKEFAEAMILTVSNSITAYDLSLAGYDYDSFEIGNYYRVEHEGLDIDYDVRLIEKQISIESPEASSLTFGDHGFDFKTFFRLKADSTNKLISGMIEDIKRIPDDVLKQAQTNATELIMMCTSGNVVFHLNEKMKPYEILIMDTDDITTAKNVWRWNVNGLGFSSEGYNGTYKTAITMNGAIVADFITTGIISANLIRGGTFKVGGQNNGNGIIEVLDASGNVIAKLDVNGLEVVKGEISGNLVKGGTIIGSAFQNDDNQAYSSFYVTKNGYMHAADGDIGGLKISSDKLYSQYGNTSISSDSIGSLSVNAGDSTLSTIGGSLNMDSNGGLQWGDYYCSTHGDNRHALSPTIISDLGKDYSSAWWDAWFGGSVNAQWGVFSEGINVEGSTWKEPSKNAVINTQSYGKRALRCYETATPMFGDIGTATLDGDGVCYVYLDDIFLECINSDVEYAVFLQPYGKGDCYIAGIEQSYFIVKGEPGLRFVWEVKCNQIANNGKRLEDVTNREVLDNDENTRILNELTYENELYVDSLINK